MKNYIIALVSLPLIFGFHYASGQQKEEKKVIIIKEHKDEKGNKVKEEVIKSGESVEKIIIRQDKESEDITVTVEKDSNGNEVKKIEKRIEVTVDSEKEDGSTKKVIIKMKGEDGKEKIIEWEGEGDIPAEIREEMEEMEIHVEMEEHGKEGKIKIIKLNEEGEMKVIDMQEDVEISGEEINEIREEIIIIKDGKVIHFDGKGEGDEQIIILKEGSEEVEWERKHQREGERRAMEERRIIERERAHQLRQEAEGRRERMEGNQRFEIVESGRPILGVAIEPHVEGLEIQSVAEDTPAAKAGLMVGDVIYMVNKKHVGSTLQLTSALKDNEGKVVKMKILRNGDKKTVKAQL